MDFRYILFARTLLFCVRTDFYFVGIHPDQFVFRADVTFTPMETTTSTRTDFIFFLARRLE